MIAVRLAARAGYRIRLTGSLRHYYFGRLRRLRIVRLANYLVTGGAGFIGSHISEALLTRGHRVRVVDNFITGYQHNLREGVEFMEGDCADPGVSRRRSSPAWST